MQHTCNGILLSFKKEWKFAICKSMDDQVDIKLSEINQQRKTNTVCYDLNVELKGKKKQIWI